MLSPRPSTEYRQLQGPGHHPSSRGLGISHGRAILPPPVWPLQSLPLTTHLGSGQLESGKARRQDGFERERHPWGDKNNIFNIKWPEMKLRREVRRLGHAYTIAITRRHIGARWPSWATPGLQGAAGHTVHVCSPSPRRTEC